MFARLRALCLLSAFFVASASAAITQYVAPLGLTGSQEVPPVATTATGTGTASYDSLTMILSVSLTWQGLTGPAGAAHIHCCPGPGANATVAIDFAGFPNLDTGTFTQGFDLTDPASYGGGFLAMFPDVDAARTAFLAGINANLAYFNIHTPMFGSGEIRGDIQVIPEPASIALIGLGLTAVMLRRRFI
jgi:CHRD domain/PEP-CTERM motif